MKPTQDDKRAIDQAVEDGNLAEVLNQLTISAPSETITPMIAYALTRVRFHALLRSKKYPYSGHSDLHAWQVEIQGGITYRVLAAKAADAMACAVQAYSYHPDGHTRASIEGMIRKCERVNYYSEIDIVHTASLASTEDNYYYEGGA